ncbi:MAG: formate dehydrogenase accessory protein FdhE [Desulfovibrio sp.]|jgi:FdhE protein|nr:formate dehydrogenase accessory protein FdhE [Desulfovibrio sp.]
MQTAAEELSPGQRAVRQALSRAGADLPALAPMLSAFGPVLAWRVRAREAAPGWQGPLPAIDEARFCLGAFLLDDSGFEDMSASLPQAARELLPILAASFPAVAGEFQALLAALESGVLSPPALAGAAFGEPAEAPGDIPGVTPATLGFAAAELVQPFIERQAQDLLPLVKELPWRQSCCPVCGGAPNMSLLRKTWDESEFIQAHGGRRFLRCSCCSSEWTAKRVSCPACGCEEPDELTVLRDPERPFERADACTRCKSFVLCLDTAEMAEIPAPEVAALTMLPLELKAREQGFTPMAGHPWSGL